MDKKLRQNWSISTTSTQIPRGRVGLFYGFGGAKTLVGFAETVGDIETLYPEAFEDVYETSDDDECAGHPAGPFDPMGATVYCDGSCLSSKAMA